MDANWLRLFRKRLIRWYERNGRSLPWRATEDPYSIWVSEVMLQQTQVATVLPYYARFLTRFETIQALAEADETEVLKYWEGLGYYRRARQMHAAARQMVLYHQAEFPKNFDEVHALPGIGRYTAGAICSFAYNQATPIVEANTQRLYARLLRIEEPLTDKGSQDSLWAFAEKLLPRQNSRTINQAVMELGSLVCQPKPRCDACPLIELCPTFAESLQEKIPAPKKKTLYEDRHEAALIVVNSQKKVLIRQQGPDEWWTGLWDFPRLEVSSSKESKALLREVELQARQVYEIDCQIETALFSVKHSVTKYRITLTCFRANLHSNSRFTRKPTSQQLFGQPCRWVSFEELESIPLSASGRRVVKKLLVQKR
jgi:A/G-specific adenine glycosylase